MYPVELEIKDTIESNTFGSYLDLILSIGWSEVKWLFNVTINDISVIYVTAHRCAGGLKRRGGQLHTSIYDERDDFNFHITNFPFLSCNIPASPAYGVFISQLLRYARACSSNECFILRAARLSNKLLEQGYVTERLKSSLKFYGPFKILLNNTKFLSHECLMTFCSLAKYNENPPPIRLYTDPWPFYRTRPFTDLWEVSIDHLRRL